MLSTEKPFETFSRYDGIALTSELFALALIISVPLT